MQQRRKSRTKYIAVLSFIVLFLVLELVVGYIQKNLRLKFTLPQEVAEYVYKGEPESIILGKNSCFIFNRFFKDEAEYMISPCIDGNYEIEAKIRSNFIAGKSQLLHYIDFLQAEGSNDQYIVVVGRGYPSEITVYDDKGTDFYLFFYEEQVEGTEFAPYFWAVGYLDPYDLSSYTVTVRDSHESETICVEQQSNGSFAVPGRQGDG